MRALTKSARPEPVEGPQSSAGLISLGQAFKALTYDEMMEAAEMFVELLQINKGPIVKPSTMAETLNDLLEALES